MKRANNSRIIVQNLKTMAVVQLNVLATGQDFAIDDSQIIEVIPINSAADSTLVYEELGRVQKIDVDETASAIASASGTVFSVTAYLSGSSGSTVTRYLSAVKCKQLIEFTSYRAIEYNNAGVELLTINVSDSLATLIAAINVSSSDFVTIAGAQTVTGAKTFSSAILVSSTTDATTKDTGSIITEGGIGVEKAVFAGTTITATTGFKAGSGTQIGSDTPSINTPSGIITTAVTATVPQAYKTVTLTNTLVTATSKCFVSIGGYGGTGIPVVAQVTTSANTVTILILNAEDTGGSNLSAAMDLYFFIVN